MFDEKINNSIHLLQYQSCLLFTFIYTNKAAVLKNVWFLIFRLPICRLFNVISFELILRNTGVETVSLGNEATHRVSQK